MAAISRTVSLRQLQSCNVCVVGGGLVGAATAMALAEAGVDGVRVLNGSACGMPSSSNDVSRLVGVRGSGDAAAANASVRAYRKLEERSGVPFYHEAGVLEVVQGGAAPPSLPQGCSALSFDSFFDGVRGFDALWTAKDHGYIDPRGLTGACRAAAEKAGAKWHDDAAAARVEGSAGQFVVSSADGATRVSAKVVVLAAGAFSSLSPGLTAHAAPDGRPLDTLMWGKVLYHARLSERSARELASLPTLYVRPTEGTVPAPTVNYSGGKAGMYIYTFPPLRYGDGHAYLKVGHSPYDPIIATLGTAPDAAARSSSWPPPPSDDQVRGWYAGGAAAALSSSSSSSSSSSLSSSSPPDTSTPIGRETADIVDQSVDFFKDVLGRLLPSAEFVDGAGFATTCVTCKSRSGERLLAELAPGLIQQTGCNGGGATAAVAWGAEVADEARAALGRI
jgi:sarcosine oxidase